MALVSTATTSIRDLLILLLLAEKLRHDYIFAQGVMNIKMISSTAVVLLLSRLEMIVQLRETGFGNDGSLDVEEVFHSGFTTIVASVHACCSCEITVLRLLISDLNARVHARSLQDI